MCYTAYSNFQRQEVVANMTAGEVLSAKHTRDFYVLAVCNSKLAVSTRVYQLLCRFVEGKSGADLVFAANGGE